MVHVFANKRKQETSETLKCMPNHKLASYLLMAGMASCKNMSSPAVSGANLARSLAIVSPVFEKMRSDGADVAGMQSHC
jgi:hypothetical protein